MPWTWSQGITSRPLASWTPWHGPVAYQLQVGSLTSPVISRGSSQLSPSSRLQVTHTVRGALPSTIRFSGPSAKFLQNSSQTMPVSRSSTGAALPSVSGPVRTITRFGSQLRPPSRLRRSTRSMSPESPPITFGSLFLPSQIAKMAPLPVVSSVGVV